MPATNQRLWQQRYRDSAAQPDAFAADAVIATLLEHRSVRAYLDRPLPAGTLEGSNDWNRTGYGGPCPPIGRHRYFHKLYALDVVLPDLARPTKAALEKAMAGHILAQATLLGTYAKGR